MKLTHKAIDFNKDIDYILEKHCQINYECESSWVRADKDYLKYRNDWFNNKQQVKDFLDAIKKSTIDKRTIAEIIINEEERFVGYIWMPFFEDKESGFLMSEIQDIYIEEEFRNKGIATNLMIYLETMAKNSGARVIRSGTGSENIISINLHKKQGFKIYRYEFEKKLS